MQKRHSIAPVLKAGLFIAVLAIAQSGASSPANAFDWFGKKKATEQKAATPAPAPAPVQAAPAAPAATPAPVAMPAPAAAPAVADTKPKKPVVVTQAALDAAVIDVPKLTERMKGKNPPYLIDVREPVEYMEFHIEGAVSIPLGSIAGAVASLPKDRDVVVYCRSGRRSEIAQKAMMEMGMTNVLNLMGGISTWVSHNKCDVKKTKSC